MSNQAKSVTDIQKDQIRHGQEPSPVESLIDAVLAKLSDRQVPVRARWLRRPAAARYIGIDPDTLLSWAGQKKGPKYRRIGSRVVYDVRDLDGFVLCHPQLASGTLEELIHPLQEAGHPHVGGVSTSTH